MVVCLVRLTCFYSCLRDWLRLISVVARDCLILVKDGKQIKRKDDCQYISFYAVYSLFGTAVQGWSCYWRKVSIIPLASPKLGNASVVFTFKPSWPFYGCLLKSWFWCPSVLHHFHKQQNLWNKTKSHVLTGIPGVCKNGGRRSRSSN